ncbi:ScbR family autoregulator-binding transcription factor [Streptomyces tendae]|uniref:ScbR family autoregulator-binding transcription factor n=1 Tax=Streptomyces tendae TaxID=1932 RepID=UPI0036F7A6F0
MVKQERAVRTRQSLVWAAAEVFATDGYARASLTSISRAAGVSNGALHFHFESKQALAHAVEDEAVAMLRLIIRSTDGYWCALQRLVDATHALVGTQEQNAVVRAGFRLSGAVPPRGHGTDVRREWGEWVEQVLHAAAIDASLADDVQAADAAVAVVAATVGFERLGADDTHWTSEVTLVRFWNLMLPRLAARTVFPRLSSRSTQHFSARNKPHGRSFIHRQSQPAD